MLECPKTAQMKDFLKLFKTVMDFKGLSFIVTEQPFNKKLRPVFYFATVRPKSRASGRQTDKQTNRYWICC